MTGRFAAATLMLAFASSVAWAGPKSPAPPSPKKEPPKKEPPPQAPKNDPPPKNDAPTKPPDKRRVIGILDIKIDSGVPTEIGAQFQKDLEAQVDVKHYFLAPKIRMRDMMSNSTKWTEGCVVGPCLHDVKTQTNADVVLLAALSGSGTSFGWVVTLVRTDTGHVLGQETERCDVCTVNEALGKATRATVKLLTTIPETLPDETPPRPPPPAPPPPVTSPETIELRHRRNVTGATLTITGVAALAAGVALYYANNHADYGLGTAGAGAGLALGGVFVLAF